MIAALYRVTPKDDWIDCEITGRHWPSGAYVLREVGRLYPGVWLGYPDQVRLPGGVFEQPEVIPRNYLPEALKARRWGKYRTIREACGVAEALRAVPVP